MSYLERHRGTLQELFSVLGEAWPDHDADLISHMERRWLGTEHGPGADKREFAQEAKDKAWPLLRELEVVTASTRAARSTTKWWSWGRRVSGYTAGLSSSGPARFGRTR